MSEPTRDPLVPTPAPGSELATPSATAPAPRLARIPAPGLFEQSAAPAPIAPVAPIGHASHEVKIQLAEKGHFSGEFVVTLEGGKTGVGVDGKTLDDRVSGSIKTLESTMSVKLNDFAAKVETSMVSGEVDAAIIDNLKCAVEVTGASASVSADGVEFDLAAISVKVVGDIGSWLDLPDGMTATVDGRLTYAIGPELLAKLAPVVARKAEIGALAADAERFTNELADHGRALEAAKSKRAELVAKGAGGEALEKIEREIAEHTKLLQRKSGFLRSTLGKLKEAKKKLGTAIGAVKGKAGKRIARLVGQEVAERLGKFIAKAIPILNIVSTIFDIVEIVQAIHQIATGEAGGGGNEEGEGKKGGTGGSDGDTGSTGGSSDEAQEKLERVPERARELLTSIKRGKGVKLDEDQLMALGLMLQGLTDGELEAVKRELTHGTTATNAEQLFRSVSDVIAKIRNPSGMVSVKVGIDGSDVRERRDISVDIADHEAGESSSSGPTTDLTPMTKEETPSVTVKTFEQPDGPITTPSQVMDPDDPMNVINDPPPALLHQWFQFQGDKLMSTGADIMWALSVGSRTFNVQTKTTTSLEGGTWHAHIEFNVSNKGADSTYIHRYWVTRNEGQMVFEPYGLFDDL